MTYDSAGNMPLDYLPCRYGNSKLMYRGPRRDLDKPYVAFLGGTETHGKFIPKPFVTQLDTRLRETCVNFGYPNAGLDVFVNDPFLPNAAQKSALTVLQIPGAHNLSNRLYSVHPRRNDRIVAASRTLQMIYPDVDFAGFHFTKHLLTHLHNLSEDRYRIVEDELRQAWIARIGTLVERVSGRIVLLWVARRTPDEDDGDMEPMLVNREMLEQVQGKVTAVVEVSVPPSDDPDPTNGMVFGPTEEPMAREIPGPKVHKQVTEALFPVLHDLLN